MKYALVFPGQGSQKIGMGQELFNAFPIAKSVFEEADDALNFNLTRLIFEGDENELVLTQNSQPAILTVSIAALRVLTDEMNVNLKPECSAGHSLGEYTALISNGVLSFWDGVKLVRERGRLMQEAIEPGKGAMAAILGLSSEQVYEVCKTVSQDNECQPANFNAPGQVVISGLNSAVENAINEAKAKGAKRAIKLSVSAPFHSKYMAGAADKLKLKFKNCTWNKSKWPVIANVNAKPVNDDEIQNALYKQTFSPVLWEDSVKFMANDLGVDTFFELGNGEVLNGLIKRIVKGVNIKSASTPSKLEEIAECLR